VIRKVSTIGREKVLEIVRRKTSVSAASLCCSRRSRRLAIQVEETAEFSVQCRMIVRVSP